MDTAVGTKTTGPYTEITHRIAHTHTQHYIASQRSRSGSTEANVEITTG